MSGTFAPLLTTEDNPHNPFTEWDSWYNFDITKGYDTCGLLARITRTNDEFDDGGTLQAMYEIIRDNFSGVHMMVTRDTFDELMSPSS